MAYRPRWDYTNRIVNDLLVIEAAREFVDAVPMPPAADLVLRQRARVRSTHASTAIEGNPIPAGDVAATVLTPSAKATPPQSEVRNYWRALEWLEERAEAGDGPSEAFIRRLHALVLTVGPGRPRQLSSYRQQQVVVRDAQTGAVEYMGPEWKDVPELMQALSTWTTSEAAKELPAVVRAGILAYQFVTIHPFMDGNGRTARALATFELWRSGYAFRGYMAMEDYYARDLPAYYNSLQMGLHHNYYFGRHDPDLTPWLTYFAGAMRWSAEEVRSQSTRWRQQEKTAPTAPRLHLRLRNLLVRCLNRAISAQEQRPTFTPGDVVDWFGVSDRTARDWLDEWRGAGFVAPASGEARVRRWWLGAPLQRMLSEALHAGIRERDQVE
jgi:Fic family protein